MSSKALAGEQATTAAERAPTRAALARAGTDLAVALGLLVLSLAYYYPVVGTALIMFDFDIWLFFYPLRQYAVDALQNGRFPLWSPEIFLGSPFFANAQTAVLYPLNAVFLLLPVPYAYAVSLWLHTWLAGVFTYLLARRMLRLSLVGALVAALAFSLGGFMTGLAGHINQAQASAWLPLLAILLLQAVWRRSVRWAVAAALVLGLQVLAGHTQEVYLTLVTLGIVTLLAPWLAPVGSERPTVGTPGDVRPNGAAGGAEDGPAVASSDPESASGGTRRGSAESSWVARGPGALLRRLPPPLADRLLALGWSLGLYALMVGLGLALVAVQVVPTAELQREGIRGGGLAYPEAISFSLPPTLLLQALLPGFWRNPFGEYVGYIGVIPLGLAVLGMAVAAPRLALLGGLLAGLGLALAVGGYNPLYPLFYQWLPGLNLFRVPARWLFVYSFGAALLAGLGAEWVWRAGALRGEWRKVLWPRVAVVALLVGFGAGLLFASSSPLGARRFYVVWGGLALLGVVLVALALRGWRRLALSLLVVAIGAELVAASAPAEFRAAIPPDAYRAARPVLAPVLAEGDYYRVLSLARDDYLLGEIVAERFPYPDLPPQVIHNYSVAQKLNEVLSHDLPLEYHVASVDGYDGGVLPLRRWVELMRRLVEEDEPRIDGVLRHRLHYLPDERLVDLLNVRWVLTSTLQDATVDGVPYDRLATRRLAPGERFELSVADRPAVAVALLTSVAEPNQPDGATAGRLTAVATDGRTQAFDVRLGRHTTRAAPAGQADADLPTAGPPDPRLRNVDYATRLPLVEPLAVARLVFENPAPTGTWMVRAATLLPPDGGPAQPLTLSPSLERMPHDDPSPVRLYRNRTALPPVFLVPRTIVADDGMALAHLRGEGFRPAQVALVAPGPGARTLEPPADDGAASAAGEGVRVLERAPERWLLATEAPAERFLVLTQSFFPGWQATVDGVPTPLVRADYMFQGLYVPAGAHQVEIAYRPRSLVVGAAISLAALLAAVVLFALAGRRWGLRRRAGGASGG